jgi:MFS family permease
VFQVGSIAGPAVGGALFAALGDAWKVYALSAAMGLVGAGLVALVPRPGVPTRADNRGGPLDGLRFVLGRPEMFAALSLDLVAVLFGGVVALLPIYARDVLGGGPDTLGWLRAAPAVGATVSALWIGRFPIVRRAGPKMLWSVVIFGLATVAFAVSTSLAFSLAMLFAAGVADEVSVVIRHCIVQLATPNEMRGRVSAVNFLFVSVSNELGQFESGLAAAWLGLVPAAVLGGGVAVISALVVAVAVPALRRFDRLV